MSKGSKSRVTNRHAYRQHFDNIDWTHTTPKTHQDDPESTNGQEEGQLPGQAQETSHAST